MHPLDRRIPPQAKPHSTVTSPKPRIRVIALGLIRNGSRILVSQGYDVVKQMAFYRALGGGIEFGETGEVALKREFQEEIQAELTQIQYLGCIENVFTYNGKAGHELIQLYQAALADPSFYQLEVVPGQEGSGSFSAVWVEIELFQSGELRLVPEQCLDYL